LPRLTLHFLTVLLTLVFACGVPGAFAKKEKKVTPPPPPPPPIPQRIKVLRDSTIEITLKIYGRKNQPITYLVRRSPKGSLTKPKNTELEAAIVEYKAPADPAVTTDSFEYSARSDLGVSATALVEIEIIDIPAEIIAPVEVTFGPTLTGSTEKQTFEIQNNGGTVAEGDLFVDPPWHIEVSPHYRLEPGQKRSVAITFTPDQPGDLTTELRFSSQPGRVTTLRGKAIPALETRPKSLRLDPVTGALVRAAALEVVNNTTEPQMVQVSGSARLLTDGPLTLNPGQSGTLMVRTNRDDVRPLNGELILESGGHRTTVSIQAEALPGVLQSESTKLELRAIAPGGEPVAEFTVRNLGGGSASADLVTDAEFKLSTNRITLPASGEAKVEVRLIPGVNPPIDGTVEIKSGGFSQRITLSAIGKPTAPTPARKTVGKRPSSKASASESEAPERNTEWSPYETDPTAPIDPVNIIRTVAMGPTSCSLEWHVDRTHATKFIAETRELKIENGQLARIWHKHRAFTVEKTGNHFRGTIEQLQPNRMYNIRVRGLGKGGEPGATVFEASVTTRPNEARSAAKTWKVVSIVGAVVALAFFWLRRLRASATPAFDPTKTQKIY
jgi:hypothetical protein